MFSYWFVGYAILNEEWIKKHGSQWRSGRIEVHHPEHMFSVNEIDIVYDGEKLSKDIREVIKNKQPFIHFEDWIDVLVSKKELTLEEIISLYKERTTINLSLIS